MATIVDALSDHFSRAWDMIIEAIGRVPNGRWAESREARFDPARVAYHILNGTERYTWLDAPEDFLPKRKHNLNWLEAPLDQLPDRATTLSLLAAAKAATLGWVRHFGPERLVSDRPTWPWTGGNLLAQALYHLRHLQHHLAELNAELRRLNLTPVAWK